MTLTPHTPKETHWHTTAKAEGNREKERGRQREKNKERKRDKKREKEHNTENLTPTVVVHCDDCLPS